jgi:CheY-like chemotaxis protein
MRVLLIDDDKDDQTLFRDAVKMISPDIECDVADNGNEGLAMLNRYRKLPGLLFLDINMPIMDGRETLKLIRESAHLRTLPVIIYSTSNNPREIEKFVKEGAEYIVKGNSFSELVTSLSKPLHALVRIKETETF